MKHIALTYHASPDEVAQALISCIDQPLIIIQITDSLGGIWTDYKNDYEWIRIGRPISHNDPYFDYLRPRTGYRTALSLMLERTLYIRQCHHLHLCEEELLTAAKHAVGKLDVKVGWGRSHRRPLLATKGFIRSQLRQTPLSQGIVS